MEGRDQQIIYINLDDSGALNNNEKFCVYGGVIFYSKKEKDRFITQYRNMVVDIKCHYCKKGIVKCDKQCPELKSSNLHNKHRRRIMNYIEHYQTMVCVIINDDIKKESIKEDNATRRRYTDYAIKMAIKNMINDLIISRRINPNKPVRLYINMDQQTTKSNAYYSLSEGMKEELIHGISNFDYGIFHKPILFSALDIELHYLSSATSYVIQASDLVAGTVRRIMLNDLGNEEIIFKKLKFVTFKTILP